MSKLPNGANQQTTHYADKWFRLMYGKWIENPDKTLEDNADGQGIDLYTKMLRLDSHMAFCFRKRRGAVVSLEWDIQPGGKASANAEQRDFIKAMFDRLEEDGGFGMSRDGMLLAVAYGYRPAEVLYALRNGRVEIERVLNRDPQRFRFDKDDKLVYMKDSMIPVPCEPWKFMQNTWGSDETPYGQGLLRELYPLWFFKSNGLKDFTRYLEKIGTGWMIGSVPIGTSDDERSLFVQMLQELQSNNVGTVPDGSKIEIAQAEHNGVQQIFSWIIEGYVDKKITLSVLEQTTSTETESGTYALGRFQSKGEQRLIEADAKWQQAQINRLIRLLIDWNYGPPADGLYPRFRYAYEEDKDLGAIADALQKVVNLGVPVTTGYALDRLGLPVPEGTDTDALLEKAAPVDPFGMGGFGGKAAGKTGEEEEDGGNAENKELGEEDKEQPEEKGAKKAADSADDLMLAAAGKKKDLVALRFSLTEKFYQSALGQSGEVYRKYLDDATKTLKKYRSMTEALAYWTPQAPSYMVKHYRDVIMTGDLLGQAMYFRDMKERGFVEWAERNGYAVPEFMLTDYALDAVAPMPPRKAWKEFSRLVPMTKDEFNNRLNGWDKKAFTVAGLENERVVMRVKQVISEGLQKGELMKDVVARIDSIYDAAGVTSTSQWHLETVYRTNVQSAVNAARYRELMDSRDSMSDFFPDLEYVTAGDDAVRDEHAALDGLIYPVDHPFWSVYYPPNGFNCRCMAIERTAIEKERGAYEPRTDIPADIERPQDGFDRPPLELSEDIEVTMLEILNARGAE